MSSGGANRRNRSKTRRSIVVIFGESPNDTQALAALIEGLCPALEGRVKPRRNPLMMVKGLDRDQAQARVRKTVAALRAEQAREEVVCIFLHEDADAVEPAHEAMCETKEGLLAKEGLKVHAVVPAWEMETWLLQWPDEIRAHNPSWRLPDKYRGKSVGLLVNSKEALKAAVRPPNASGSFRDYEELDAPGIARLVKAAGKADSPEAQSASYDRFRDSVADCCASA
jgi:hypothetical protein